MTIVLGFFGLAAMGWILYNRYDAVYKQMIPIETPTPELIGEAIGTQEHWPIEARITKDCNVRMAPERHAANVLGVILEDDPVDVLSKVIRSYKDGKTETWYKIETYYTAGYIHESCVDIE